MFYYLEPGPQREYAGRGTKLATKAPINDIVIRKSLERPETTVNNAKYNQRILC